MEYHDDIFLIRKKMKRGLEENGKAEGSTREKGKTLKIIGFGCLHL